MSTIPTNQFVSKLKSNLAASQQEVTNLQEQVSNLEAENATLKHRLQGLSPTGGSIATQVDIDRIIALEDELRRVNGAFREFAMDADDKVEKKEFVSNQLAQQLKEEKQYSANLKRQLDDSKATQKSLRVQKTQAEKKAKDADARAQNCYDEWAKAASEKRTWEAKYKREVMSKAIDGGEAAKSSINNPKLPTKTITHTAGMFSKSLGSAMSLLSTMAREHPGGPPSKHPSQGMSRLSIGSSTDQPFVVDDDEEDMPLMQRRAINGRMQGSKRKATFLQEDDDEDMDDDEMIPIKRERLR